MVKPSLYGGAEQFHIGKVRRRRRWLAWAMLIVCFVLILLLITIFFKREAVAPPPPKQSSATQNQTESLATAPDPFNAEAIQTAVSNWVASHSGAYSVVVTDSEGKTLATYHPDTQYFTASIYKLYVAYEGYRMVDSGTYSASQPYLGSYTRGDCLDQMIRISHSPCAEKMWAELGKDNLTSILKSYGLKNTSMTGLYTSAEDAAIMLVRIEQGKGLSQDSRAKLLDSMKNQIYRDALPVGFKGATVYDKVGFRGRVEYHDTAIVLLKQGTLVVSVLTKNAGTRNIAGLAGAIQQAAQ